MDTRVNDGVKVLTHFFNGNCYIVLFKNREPFLPGNKYMNIPIRVNPSITPGTRPIQKHLRLRRQTFSGSSPYS